MCHTAYCVESCKNIHSMPKRILDEYTEHKTEELKQQLTEANALIEKMRLKLIESNEKVKELSTEGDDVTAQQYVYTSWLINEVNEYKTKQTTQEVKP